MDGDGEWYPPPWNGETRLPHNQHIQIRKTSTQGSFMGTYIYLGPHHPPPLVPWRMVMGDGVWCPPRYMIEPDHLMGLRLLDVWRLDELN